MEVYLDNSATTKPYKEVIEEMSRVMEETYGNPSSMHMLGVYAENKLKEASQILAATMKCKPSEIVFTSGGTESDNMALIGVAHAKKRAGKHIITTRIEHPAVLETCEFLKGEGFEISYLDTDARGAVSVSELESLIHPDTILVSVMHTNNEIGTIEPIEEIGACVHRVNPGCIFHVDAVQGYTKAKIIPGKMNIDLMSVSAHKFHGPRGVGFLYVKDKTRIEPLIYGGGQQKAMRSGTENVAGIMGMAIAARKSYESFDEDIKHLYELKKRLAEGLIKIDQVKVNGAGPDDTDKGAPHIISASFPGIRSEVLLHALEDKGIYVSAGSACASNRPHVSATLTAIGLTPELSGSTIRFSMSVHTTAEEIDYTLDVLNSLIPTLRKYTRH